MSASSLSWTRPNLAGQFIFPRLYFERISHQFLFEDFHVRHVEQGEVRRRTGKDIAWLLSMLLNIYSSRCVSMASLEDSRPHLWSHRPQNKWKVCRSRSSKDAESNRIVTEMTLTDKPVYVSMCSLIPTKDGNDEVAVLDPSVFAHPMRRDILFLCVNFYRDALRQGSANTKTRGEVAGSGRKIRPQKGSGRARLGDGQSPMLRGGGVAFGPKPRDFATKLPRKVRMMGLRVALSAKLRENALGVAGTLDWPGSKTSEFARRLANLGWGQDSRTETLFIAGGEQVPPRLERVCRNLDSVKVLPAASLQHNVYTLLKWPRIVLDIEAVDYFERLLGKDVPPEKRILMTSPPVLRYSRAQAGLIGKHSPDIPGLDVRSRDLVADVPLFE